MGTTGPGWTSTSPPLRAVARRTTNSVASKLCMGTYFAGVGIATRGSSGLAPLPPTALAPTCPSPRWLWGEMATPVASWPLVPRGAGVSLFDGIADACAFCQDLASALVTPPATQCVPCLRATTFPDVGCLNQSYAPFLPVYRRWEFWADWQRRQLQHSLQRPNCAASVGRARVQQPDNRHISHLRCRSQHWRSVLLG